MLPVPLPIARICGAPFEVTANHTHVFDRFMFMAVSSRFCRFVVDVNAGDVYSNVSGMPSTSEYIPIVISVAATPTFTHAVSLLIVVLFGTYIGVAYIRFASTFELLKFPSVQ